jgi:hypothetical protein
MYKIYGISAWQLIGIIDCGRTENLADAAQKFEALKKKVPTLLAANCYAVEPTDSHADNTPGVVLIPNQVAALKMMSHAS